MNQHGDWVPAEAAARLLGVKRATLYAYVSRGLVRATSGAGRARLYSKGDLVRLKTRSAARAGHGAVAAGALQWGEPVLETAITEITPAGPSFRGRLAVDLAQSGAPFEAAAEILWGGGGGTAQGFFAARSPPAFGHVAALVRGAPPLAALEPLCAALAVADEERFAASPERERERARRIVGTLSAGLALVVSRRRYDEAALRPRAAARIAAALGVDVDAHGLAALDRALCVVADHELNASTFAARVAASTGADLYACVRAGLAVLSGPKHGGACDRIAALVDEVARAGRARDVLRDRLARGEEVPGFGHRLYPDGDPRTAPLLQAKAVRRAKGERLRALFSLVEAAARVGLPGPTVDLGLVAVALALDLPAGAATALFSVGRTAGLVAHALEQRERPEVLRPRARYVG